MIPPDHRGFLPSRHHTTILLAIVSVFFSLLILNRWMVTDAGIFSYRRVWQLFVNYSEFGFVRRALIGSLLSWSGLNRLFDHPYVSAYFIHGLAILILASLASLHISRHEDNMGVALKAIVFLSPAFIIQSGFNTGSLDIFILLAATVTILFVRNLYLFCLLLALGILMHELYLFTVPAQLLAFYWKTNGWDKLDVRRSITTFRLPILCVFIVLIPVLFFGRLDMPVGEFKAIMERLAPDSPYRIPHVGSGYYELSTGIAENVGINFYFYGFSYRTQLLFFLFLPLPLFYMTALAVVVARNSSPDQSWVFPITAVLFPLLASVAAGDLYRWIGMSANMSILLLLLIATDRRVRIGKPDCLAILPFTALAPFGIVLSRPFPVHQFVIEQLAM